ncbi:uncharacterized protein FFB14_07932 [Fusarium fujikuroi]|nr:uncharacterized protein FFB14_07932 [Fusarium fujikuroi]
MLIKLIEKVF